MTGRRPADAPAPPSARRSRRRRARSPRCPTASARRPRSSSSPRSPIRATALFGLPGRRTTVLDQNFNDVDLVGRPLTLGNVRHEQDTGALVFGDDRNTYSPYLILGDNAYDSSGDQVLRGKDYAETLTNFPGSQILTGLTSGSP